MAEDDKTETGDQTSVTVAKTLWSETLIELLFVALQKGFKTKYVINKVRRTLGEKKSRRVKQLLANL
jgi:hypothetical protein